MTVKHEQLYECNKNRCLFGVKILIKAFFFFFFFNVWVSLPALAAIFLLVYSGEYLIPLHLLCGLKKKLFEGLSSTFPYPYTCNQKRIKIILEVEGLQLGLNLSKTDCLFAASEVGLRAVGEEQDW